MSYDCSKYVYYYRHFNINDSTADPATPSISRTPIPLPLR